ncbi:Protein CBG26136 [Caenorhabditis briggsae]|uniref:Protein CBG26136 n=1 Tax=Caenorhabditis briggsae TaxID=6238 RepID=B6ILI7_CAEBR|nr:Protein CBG26136 [Caenorhabditis briggsae]CAS00767.1 Protein CBG26136 [Caenorhabditis briggsae]
MAGPSRRFLISLLIFALLIATALCRPDHHSRNCKAYRRPALNEVLTRICLLCHEMFSVDQPNLAAECSSNCFRNPAFNKCLNFFRPKFSPFMMN